MVELSGPTGEHIACNPDGRNLPSYDVERVRTMCHVQVDRAEHPKSIVSAPWLGEDWPKFLALLGAARHGTRIEHQTLGARATIGLSRRR